MQPQAANYLVLHLVTEAGLMDGIVREALRRNMPCIDAEAAYDDLVPLMEDERPNDLASWCRTVVTADDEDFDHLVEYLAERPELPIALTAFRDGVRVVGDDVALPDRCPPARATNFG